MDQIEIQITLTRGDGTHHRAVFGTEQVPTKAEAEADPIGVLAGCAEVAGQVGGEVFRLITHDCDGHKDTVPLGHSRN